MVRGALAGLALLLGVAAFSAGAADSGKPDLWMERVIEPTDPYVQQQVIVTTHLYRRSSFLTGYFVAPEAEGFRVVFLEESKPQVVFIDGREYERIDYRQAVFPQRSGELELPGVAYSGREVFVRGESRTLQVRPATAREGGDWWLPATAVSLSQRWEHRPARVHAGDILLRVLRLEGEGVIGAQLPALELPQTPAWRIQRLEARTGTEVDGGRIKGWREERWRMIPTQTGRHSLPGLEVAWWDLGNDSGRRAVLSAESFSVAAGASVAAPNKPLSESRGEDARSEPRGLWVSLTIALVAGAGLMVMAIAFRQRIYRRIRAWRTWRDFVGACRQNSAADAWHHMHSWLMRDNAALQVLSPLACARAIADQELVMALRELDAALYSPEVTSWDGQSLLNATRHYRKRRGRSISTRAKAGGLPALDPLAPHSVN